MVTIILFIIGFGGGLAVSAGLFALITALSLIPRMAVRTHTGKYVHAYETAVFFGAVTGLIIYFNSVNNYFFLTLQGPVLFVFLLLYGLWIGLFAGTLSISLAENLDVTAVLGRRICLHQYFAWIILAFALGKSIGTVTFFYQRWF